MLKIILSHAKAGTLATCVVLIALVIAVNLNFWIGASAHHLITIFGILATLNLLGMFIYRRHSVGSAREVGGRKLHLVSPTTETAQETVKSGAVGQKPKIRISGIRLIEEIPFHVGFNS